MTTVMMFIIVIISLAAGYSIGHKDGKREGYVSGRNISRSAFWQE